MSTIVTILGTDLPSNSRADINTNFSNLNTDKIETSYLDTDTALTANSDTKIATQKAIKAYVTSVAGGNYLVPTGAVMPYAGSSAPTNFLLCDGSNVSRSTYATLFGVIGTTYGTGDGSSTFTLPNLKNRVPIGAGAGTVVATFASRASDTITVTGLTNASNNEFQTGQAVVYHTSSGTITGLSNDTTYYVIRATNTSFKLASSLANAQNGTQISLSSDGSGTQTFTLTFTTRTLAGYGGEENHAMSSTELLAHAHSGSTVNEAAGSGGTPNGYTQNGTGGPNNGTPASHWLSISSNGGNVAMNGMPPFVVLNYIIKT